MRNFENYIFGFILALCLCSCFHTSNVGKVLDQAEMYLTSAPDIIEVGGWKIGADVEPSILLGVPHERMEVRYRKPSGGIDRGTVSADGGQWIAWEGSIGLRASFRRLSLGVGYGISNYDAYSTARLLGVNGTAFDQFYPEHEPVVQRAFVYTCVMF